MKNVALSLNMWLKWNFSYSNYVHTNDYTVCPNNAQENSLCLIFDWEDNVDESLTNENVL